MREIEREREREREREVGGLKCIVKVGDYGSNVVERNGHPGERRRGGAAAATEYCFQSGLGGSVSGWICNTVIREFGARFSSNCARSKSSFSFIQVSDDGKQRYTRKSKEGRHILVEAVDLTYLFSFLSLSLSQYQIELS
jgi:hypothetical protein